MKDNIKNIIPGIGLGELNFGMTRNEVENLLGKPNEVDRFSYTDDDENQTESWHYDELDLSIGFDEDDEWRLGLISVSSDFYTFREQSFFGLTVEELTDELTKLTINDLTLQDCSTKDQPNHQVLTSDALETNFWFDEGVVTEIQWSPLFVDESTIIWPAQYN